MSAFAGLSAGAVVFTTEFTVERADLAAYAEASGDHNPIHLDEAAAEAAGLPNVIAHGMYTAARALAVIGPERGESFVWTVDFAKPIFLPGTVAFGVERAAGGTGWRYAGWHPKKGKVHFSGQVREISE